MIGLIRNIMATLKDKIFSLKFSIFIMLQMSYKLKKIINPEKMIKKRVKKKKKNPKNRKIKKIKEMKKQKEN